MSAEKQENKQKGRGVAVARRVVQICALVLFFLPLIVVGWAPFGLTASSGESLRTPAQLFFFGSLSSPSIGPVSLMDPFAMLQITVASRSFDLAWLWYIIPVVVVYGVIRGRSFCGWVCPVNLLLEIVDWLRKKVFKNSLVELPLPRHLKLWTALAVLVLSAIFCVPVFEIFSPITFLHKGLIFGGFAGLLTMIAIIIAELFWGHRVWCRSICPLGGMYEVIGKVGQVNIKINHEDCIGCNACKKVCLCDPEILAPAIEGKDCMVRAGDCMLCGKCVVACPTEALSFGLGRKKMAVSQDSASNVKETS